MQYGAILSESGIDGCGAVMDETVLKNWLFIHYSHIPETNH
jgi:hypothetical protein